MWVSRQACIRAESASQTVIHATSPYVTAGPEGASQFLDQRVERDGETADTPRAPRVTGFDRVALVWQSSYFSRGSTPRSRRLALKMKALYLGESAAFVRYLELPGAGDAVVWLHGVLCSSTGEFIRAAVEPGLRGYRHVLVDFLGHGYSDRPAAFDYRGM